MSRGAEGSLVVLRWSVAAAFFFASFRGLGFARLSGNGVVFAGLIIAFRVVGTVNAAVRSRGRSRLGDACLARVCKVEGAEVSSGREI